MLFRSERGIVLGDNGLFSPESAITREQLAAMLYRYAGSPSAGENLGTFTDSTNVSDWARAPLNWAVAAKYIGGTTATTLSPQDTATRAQLAMVLYRMSE